MRGNNLLLKTSGNRSIHGAGAMFGRIIVACAASLLISATSMAEPRLLVAQEDPNQISTFTLDFGVELGGVASSRIARTDYELEVDAEMGTARFVRYDQQVDALILPGGFSTGNITIQVVEGSSTGTYDRRTGIFVTSELYAVHFEGDLSAFGLESPVLLPSTSTGFVLLDAQTGGTIGMEWVGEGELANPFDPNSTIQFAYTCEVNTQFAIDPDLLVRLVMIPNVLNLELPRRLENNLVTLLQRTTSKLDRDNTFGAAGTLRAFVRKVGNSRLISDEDANLLISGAQEIIALLRPTRNEELR